MTLGSELQRLGPNTTGPPIPELDRVAFGDVTGATGCVRHCGNTRAVRKMNIVHPQ
jgi:hypothetical protein